MSRKSLACIAFVLMASTTQSGCFEPSDADAKAACGANNDPTPVYVFDADDLTSPVPTVGAETSVFVALAAHPTMSCYWASGDPDWFTGNSEERGCHCDADTQPEVFELADVGCPDGSCQVVHVGGYVEIYGRGEYEVRLVPKAPTYSLRVRMVPESDPARVIEETYEGEAAAQTEL